MPLITCPTCSADVRVTETPEVAMGAGDVVVRVQGLGRATCPAGHSHVLPVDAADRAADEVAERLVGARTRGVLRRREVCGFCDADLDLPPRPSHRPVPVPVDDRVLTVVVEAPMVRCPACSHDQLTAAAGAAVAGLLQAAVNTVIGDEDG
jgi:hypothetical protein